jgi:catechol 2,3-dioxygenase-like lactoylglutathione lyase family enzyme
VLHVPDVAATAKFYRDVLGFAWDFGDETYAVVWRDNSAIHFVRDAGSPKGVHLFQWVRDIDSYHRELIRRGAEGVTEPKDQPYGIREFGVRDINSKATFQLSISDVVLRAQTNLLDDHGH